MYTYLSKFTFYLGFNDSRSTPCVMFNELNWNIVLSMFETQSCYYVHVLINTFLEGINPTYRLVLG